MFSELPDDILLAILQLLDLRTAVRVGAVARRLMRLPRLLTDLVIDVGDLIPHSWDFSPHTAEHVMATYTYATRWFLAPSKERSIKSLRLAFHLKDPYLRSIGDAVVESGRAERLEFAIRAQLNFRPRHVHHAVFARRLMAFVAACPVAFGWLTSLTLQNISFSDSDMPDLLNAGNRLELLSLIRCGGSDLEGPNLRIDAPRSSLRALEIRDSLYPGIELTSLPKLDRLFCDDSFEHWAGNFYVRFGDVPRLHHVNLSSLHLYYCYGNPGQLFPAFSNLRAIHLCHLDIKKMFCLHCGRAGHFQSECSFDPLCIICSKEGHSSVSCPTRGKPLLLQSMGHAISGGGFFNIDVEPIRDEGQGDQFAAVVKFKGAPLSDSQLSDELKNLVDDLWDWQVTKVTESEFTVKFPSRATLKMSTGSGKLYLPLSKTGGEIREAFLAPHPGKALPSTWVRLTGVPRDLLEVDRLMAAMVMVRRPLEVDTLSLRKWTTEPIRMRFQCRYPERIKGTI
ncbi:hypothetical protein QYE76_064665 [Lolium multiflorum]|uniref:CCHC-type domain-containing protein n=1 Tax=Lolium multiflorum TaxID=4521 RepID=A0AAD8S9E1_LOLMU|nr:hypothetical protein QYE76_064665 [Lolium multiflorum]